jgi:hypothetical protein
MLKRRMLQQESCETMKQRRCLTANCKFAETSPNRTQKRATRSSRYKDVFSHSRKRKLAMSSKLLDMLKFAYHLRHNTRVVQGSPLSVEQAEPQHTLACLRHRKAQEGGWPTVPYCWVIWQLAVPATKEPGTPSCIRGQHTARLQGG